MGNYMAKVPTFFSKKFIILIYILKIKHNAELLIFENILF
jgi:hypothetical protein